MYAIIILKGKKEQAKALIYRRQQIINVEKNADIRKSPLCNPMVTIDSGKDHPWMLKLLDERLLERST